LGTEANVGIGSDMEAKHMSKTLANKNYAKIPVLDSTEQNSL